MSKCRQCNVEVSDKTQVCPLCKCVLEQTEEVGENRYPDIRVLSRKLYFISRILLFTVIITELLLIYINYHFYNGTYWSVITGVGLIYAYFAFRMTLIDENIGYKVKIIGAVLLATLFVIIIDSVFGFKGWSANYALPSGLMVVDVITLAFMLWNKRNWQSYIMIELMNIVFSLIPLALILFGVVTKPFVSYLNVAIASVIFLGTFIIGDRRARSELRRRFHV